MTRESPQPNARGNDEHSSLQSVSKVSISKLAALYDAKGSGLSPRQSKQTRACIGALTVAPHVFQPRNMADLPWEKQKHIAGLAKALRDTGTLDAIEVFAIDGTLYVVDGHCRLAAYRQAGFREADKIPVRHLQGCFADALVRSASANSKDKLSFTKADKLEAAWRLVLYEDGRNRYSVRVMEAATTISKSTIQNMRSALNALDAESRNLPGSEVKLLKRPVPEYDETWKDKLAHSLAVRLLKHFSDKPNLHPEVWLQAYEEAFPRLHGEILDVVAREHLDELRDMAEEIAAAEDF
jgi:hypothetical protein